LAFADRSSLRTVRLWRKKLQPSEVAMAFEQLEEALLELKQARQKEEAAETQRRNAATTAITKFALIKSEILGPIFNKAAAILTEEGLFSEITDQENGSISLKVDLSTDTESGPQGSLIFRLDEDMQTCQFGKAMTQNTEPVFVEKLYKLQEITEEIAYRTTEKFLVDLIATVSANRPTGTTSRGNAA
jgi:hypothetical protein